MKLRMISSDNLREMEVEWIGITTPSTHHIIGNGHAPYIAQLKNNSALQLYLPGGAVTSVPIGGGVVYSDRQTVTIILVDEV